jgi:hypothetical protein
MQGKNRKRALREFIIFCIGIAIVFPADVLTQHFRMWFNYGIVGHNYEAVCKDWVDGWLGMFLSALFLLLALILLFILIRSKDENDITPKEDTVNDIRLQSLKLSQIETNKRLDRMESMLDEIIRRHLM